MEKIFAQKQNDMKKRTELSVPHLRKWQQTEINQLRETCRDNKILFSVISNKDGGFVKKVVNMIVKFLMDNEGYNQIEANDGFQHIVPENTVKKRMPVFDADRTIVPGVQVRYSGKL